MRTKQKWVIASVLIIVVSLSMLVLAFAMHRRSLHALHCIVVMRFIEAAKDQYQVETGAKDGTVVTKEKLVPWIRKWDYSVMCFSGGMHLHNLGKLGEDPTCPYHGTIPQAYQIYRNPWQRRK